MIRVEVENEELRRLRAIARVHRAIGDQLELDKIARLSVRELVDLTGCDGCAIIQVGTSNSKVLAETGFSIKFGVTELSNELPAIKQILTTQQSIITGNIQASPAAGCVPHGCSMASLICVPIIVGDSVKGIIHLDAIRMNAFTGRDIEFCLELATVISMAYSRAILYENTVELAGRDGLTGCFNRRKLDTDLDSEIGIANQQATSLSILLMDVDHFKSFNDFHGHIKGDAVLRQLTRVIGANLRGADRLYRYGGDEFVVLLPETNKPEAEVIAKRVQRVIETEPFSGKDLSQHSDAITVSIGVATIPTDADSAVLALQKADFALYRAKREGRNTTVAYGEGTT